MEKGLNKAVNAFQFMQSSSTGDSVNHFIMDFVHEAVSCWNRKVSYSTVNVCLRRLNSCMLDFMHLLGCSCNSQK